MLGEQGRDLWQLIAFSELLAVSMAALGALVVVGLKRISHVWLCALISFAAGGLLAVSLLDLFPETIKTAGWFPGAASILSGYLLFFFITRFVFHICPACAATHTEIRFKAITSAMVIALGVHCFMDGLAISSGFLAESAGGILTVVAVSYHKLPEGMALALVGLVSGMRRRKAFGICILLESGATIAGGLAGYFALFGEPSRWMGYVTGHVGGGFIFLAVHALLSEFIKHHPRSAVMAAVAGAVSVGVAGYWIGAY